MANKIQKMTNNSWIVNAGHEKTGLLTYNEIIYKFFSNTGTRREFKNISDVEKYLKIKIEEDNVSLSLITNINGFPTKHENIEIISEDPPMYKKIDSNMIFLAGYYGFKYSAGWSLVFCPKQDTKNNYKWVGPFRNKIEAKVEINRLNSEDF